MGVTTVPPTSIPKWCRGPLSFNKPLQSQIKALYFTYQILSLRRNQMNYKTMLVLIHYLKNKTANKKGETK